MSQIFLATSRRETFVDGILVYESDPNPELVVIGEGDGLVANPRFVTDFRIRKEVHRRILEAKTSLPKGLNFMIFEAYRPRSRQIDLWNRITERLKHENPTITEESLMKQANVLVANPYGFGSGHQAAAAIDVTLCDAEDQELFMGSQIKTFDKFTKTDAPGLPPDCFERRKLLKNTLEIAGLVNYPDEWWHFSYGDRLWAEVTGRDKAFFAPID